MSMDTIKFADLPRLRELLDGGAFGGLTTLPDGRHYAVVLLKERPEQRLNWQEALDWAASIGGQLITPAIALLLHANCPDLLPQTCMWTDKPEGSSYAWYCDFKYGYFGTCGRSGDGGAVGVRLIPIIT
jgi:hypothetical protein